MATLGKTTITDLNVLNNIKENNTSLVDKYTTLSTDQTISGKKTFSNGLNITGGCTENKSMPYYLGIDAFQNGGSVKWIAAGDISNSIGAVSKNSGNLTQLINGNSYTPLALNNTMNPDPVECGLGFRIGGTSTGWVGAHSAGYTYLYTYTGGHKLGIKTDGTGFIDSNTIITTGNIGSQTSGYATKLTLNPTGLAGATHGSYGGIIQDTDDNPTGIMWTNKIKILHGNTNGYYTELAQSFTDAEGLWHRRMNNGNLSSWKKVLDENGGTLNGSLTLNSTLILNDENLISQNIERCKTGGGGWATHHIQSMSAKDSSGNRKMLSVFGTYGTSENLGYSFIGSGDYSNTNNLRVYPSGEVTAKKFTGAFNGNATSATSASKLNLSSAVGGQYRPVYFKSDGTPSEITGIGDLSIVWNSASSNSHLATISPLDTAASSQHSANRLAFANPSGITVEYSTDGTNWIDYGLTDAQKIGFVSDIDCGMKAGKGLSTKATANDKLRITFNAQSMGVYTMPKSLLIYMSTNGSVYNNENKVRLDVETAGTDGVFKSYVTNCTVAGWSGWNKLPLTGIRFGGGLSDRKDKIRLTFSSSGAGSSYTSGAHFTVNKFVMIGEPAWGYPSAMALNGHLYGWKYDQTMTLPSGLEAKNIIASQPITLSGTTKETARLIFSRSGAEGYNYINWPGNSSTSNVLAFGYSNSSDASYYYMSSEALYPQVNKAKNLGKSDKQWNNIYGNVIYENGTSLANKYQAKGSYIPTSEKVDATTPSHTNWSTNGTYVPTMNFLSYWNGAYNSSGNSNLSHCNKGAFGTAATKDIGYFATASHTHSYLPLSGGTLTNDLSILTGDSDKFINYIYTNESPIGASWRIGVAGSGTGDTNYFKIQSGTSGSGTSTWYDVVKFGQNTFDATFTGNILPSGNASKNLGSSSYKWNNVYAEDFNGNATSATKISKIVSVLSNSNTNTGKYIKFGTIEITKAWEYAGGLFHIYTQESFALDGLLACHIRSSSTIETESVSLYWLSINKSSMLDSISIVKTANGKFDLYFKANEHYMSLMVECYSQVPDKITLSSSGSWVDSITPRATSSDGRIYKFTGTSHSHTITPSGSVSSTFTGKAVTSGGTTAGGSVSSTFTGTPHPHTASLSGSVTSGVLTISVTVDSATAGGNVSSTFTGTSHTHSVTANGTVSSTFTGTSSQSTSSVTATGTIG